VDLLLPAELLQVVQQEIVSQLGNWQYAKVMMSLGEIIEGDFFTEYIKKGLKTPWFSVKKRSNWSFLIASQGTL